VDAEKKFRMSEPLLIPNFLRHLDIKSAMNSLDQVLDFMEKVSAQHHHIVGIELDLSKLGSPHLSLFSKAWAAGFLKVCVHVGEEGPPSCIVDTLDNLGAN
jgi:adenosine deaminase